MSEDRTVYAICADRRAEVVRYDRAGKWWLEYDYSIRAGGARMRHPLKLPTAVAEALSIEAGGGNVLYGRPGGAAFYAALKRARATTTTEASA